jgi:hypothetical protein
MNHLYNSTEKLRALKLSFLNNLISLKEAVLKILVLRSRNLLPSLRSSYQDVTTTFVAAIHCYHGKNQASRQ